MITKLSRSLLQDCRLIGDQPVLVGVSGGADSLSLLHAMMTLGYPVIAAHLNHLLRPEAESDALTLRHILEQFRVPFIIEGQDVHSFAIAHKMSIEEAAREVRYRFLFSQAEKNHAQAVVVAHSADDQVETVLMHMLRGAGLAGLRGMLSRALPNPWSEKIPLARPLLGIWRSDIEAYCTEHHLVPILDRSNLDVTIFRNRLRHELIPFLEQYYNPGARKLLWQMANTLAEDYLVLEERIDRAWYECVIAQGEGNVLFSPTALIDQPLGIRRRLIRRAIAMLRPGLRDVDYDVIERAVAFLSEHMALEAGPPMMKRDLCSGLNLVFERQRIPNSKSTNQRLWVTDSGQLPTLDFPQMLTLEPVNLPVPGEVYLGNWIVTANLCSDTQFAQTQAANNRDPFQAWISPEAGTSPVLVIRSRRAGERFRPLGFEGHSLKLSDFMINVKLPQAIRSMYPLVCEGERIIWVPGYRIAHECRLTPSTRIVLHLHLSRF
jgi:tRNA(Ile)-lysidine synthase